MTVLNYTHQVREIKQGFKPHESTLVRCFTSFKDADKWVKENFENPEYANSDLFVSKIY